MRKIGYAITREQLDSLAGLLPNSTPEQRDQLMKINEGLQPSLDQIILELLKQFGVKALVGSLSHCLFDIAEHHVLPQQCGASRNSINFRAWFCAAIAIGNVETAVENLPPYPPYHS